MLLYVVFAYMLGGLTIPPILLGLLLARWYYAQIVTQRRKPCFEGGQASSTASEDERDPFFGLRNHGIDRGSLEGAELNAAAGYFAICRVYVPDGINGKPPDRATPAGVVVATESPSVYQSIYWSIFERRNPPTLEVSTIDGKCTKTIQNVFYVVLRHRHLLLYADAKQVDVRHVIPLEHYDICLYGKETILPEGELWIKRNAIKLSRREILPGAPSQAFYLFSDNCSEKEDFYFALLDAKEHQDTGDSCSTDHSLDHTIKLINKLKSSDDQAQAQAQWLNALIGRLFLALYKTRKAETLLYSKIANKISRARKPTFLSDVTVEKIRLGESAPNLTNLHLRDLDVNGECCLQADVEYDGRFYIELSAIARIDLGTRFKVREVNLILAVVVERLSGRVLLKIKRPPSNRLWFAFEQMPDLVLSIQPVVSSMQMGYGLIRRAIESKIREIVADSVVLPHWDDIPFIESHLGHRGQICSQSHESQEELPKSSESALMSERVQQYPRDRTGPYDDAKQSTYAASLNKPTTSHSAPSSPQLGRPQLAIRDLEGTNDSTRTLHKALGTPSLAPPANPDLSLTSKKLDTRHGLWPGGKGENRMADTAVFSRPLLDANTYEESNLRLTTPEQSDDVSPSTPDTASKSGRFGSFRERHPNPDPSTGGPADSLNIGTVKSELSDQHLKARNVSQLIETHPAATAASSAKQPAAAFGYVTRMAQSYVTRRRYPRGEQAQAELGS